MLHARRELDKGPSPKAGSRLVKTSSRFSRQEQQRLLEEQHRNFVAYCGSLKLCVPSSM
jgi:hypothetical protein